MNKLLLWATGILVLGFLVTFPTRDRRGVVDRIRLQVGAKDLVSKQTLKEIKAEERTAARKAGRNPASAGDKFDIDGAPTPLERQERLNKTIAHYCNQQFNRQYCGQWLNRCGEMCRSQVNPATWNTVMAPPRKPAATPKRAVAHKPAAARKTTVAATKTARR